MRAERQVSAISGKARRLLVDEEIVMIGQDSHPLEPMPPCIYTNNIHHHSTPLR
jgi:hypothetical protein